MTVPRATYRLQLRPGFGFREAAATVEYLAALGVSHVYLSPSLQAAPGSTHGYDVVDPTRLNAELGGDEGFAELSRAAGASGLGLVLDLVPNHVGLLSPGNPWWEDVLRNGPDSRFARHFDIDWREGPSGRPQVVVPHLGKPLVEELEGEDLDVDVRDGELRVVYHEHAWPLRPDTCTDLGLPDDPKEAAAAVAEDRGRLWSVLSEQHYRLVHWRQANTELNYRRFFDISTLGAVRVEDPEVFADTHRRILDLVEDGTVDGLRIDHPDGLWDPAGYAQQLREAAPDAWIVFEKILETGEKRRADWPIDGTVGYEFANLVLGLFVDPHSEPVLTELYAQVLGERPDLVQIVADAKRQVLDELFGAELDRLTDLFEAAAGGAGIPADRDQLRRILFATLVDFPVYRTYVRAEDGHCDDADRLYIEEAIARARASHPGADDVVDLMADLLTLERGGPVATEFVMRLQQLTGPVMAKGFEDTALYRYLRFAAVNEVGGDPAHLGTSLGDFHSVNLLRQRDWPATMLTTSTHDTKRSEDVRARLAVVSELPDAWVRAVDEWRELAERYRGARGPSANHEYLTFQTLVGAWPIDADRLVAYLVKAAREEKRDTSWLDVDAAYEADLEDYARALLADEEVIASVERFLEQVIEPGWLTSLSQTLLRLTVPGVPDTYQGTELWDLSLVDPDNRRPVDLDGRRKLLGELSAGLSATEVLARMEEGLPKLWVTYQALRTRREHPEAFGPTASYDALYGAGPREDHVVSFVRGGDVCVVAPRLVVGLGGDFLSWDWGGTSLTLPDGRWHDVLTGVDTDGGERPMAELLADLPVALLVRDGSGA